MANVGYFIAEMTIILVGLPVAVFINFKAKQRAKQRKDAQREHDQP